MDMPSYLMGKRAGGGTVIETDPIFSNSAASGITSTDIGNWNNKQNELVSGTNIKTINNESILGSGNINIQGGGSSYTAGTNIEITNENVINNTIPYQYGGNTNQNMAINPGGTLSSYPNTLALGYRATVNATSGIALGRTAMVLQGHFGSIAIGSGARTTKQKQCVIGGLPDSGYDGINELAIATTNGLKVIATEDYVDNAISSAITTALGGDY